MKELQRLSFRYESFPEQAMTAREAVRRRWRATSTTCRWRRSAAGSPATLALIYPPGIGIVVPGERYDERAQPMIDYFLAFEESCNRFPGLLVRGAGRLPGAGGRRVRFYTYVVKERKGRKR